MGLYGDWVTSEFNLGCCCQILLGAQPLSYWTSLHCLCLFLLLDFSLVSPKKKRKKKEEEERKKKITTHLCITSHLEGFFFLSSWSAVLWIVPQRYISTDYSVCQMNKCKWAVVTQTSISGKWRTGLSFLSREAVTSCGDAKIFLPKTENPPHISRLAQRHHGWNTDLEYESGPTTQLHLSKI